MRRIADLAKMGVLGAFFGTVISIPVVYFLREKGVVPSIVGVAAMTIITSWWYSRKVKIHPSMNVSQVGQEAAALLKLGFAFMSSGLMTLGVAYAVRIILLRRVGFEATGLYQSAWTLGGLYVGIILQAMGADFYPRLTARANDNTACNRLVNEQARVGLLLAGPGVIATLTFAPLVMALFYSAKFGAAVGVLRWICLGATLQVITWPMGFIIVAKGKQGLFFSANWPGQSLCSLGLDLREIIRFEWSRHCVLWIVCLSRIFDISDRASAQWFSLVRGEQAKGLLLLSLIAVVFGGFYVLPLLLAASIGALAAILSGVYSIRVLLNLVSWEQLPRPLQRLIVGFVPSGFTTVN